MTERGRHLRTPESSNGGSTDWPARAADQIVDIVGSIRDKTTGPALKASRAVVYGLASVFIGVAAAVLLAVGLVRFVNVYLPDAVVGERHMWASYLLIGILFTGVGFFLWSKRTPKRAEA